MEAASSRKPSAFFDHLSNIRRISRNRFAAASPGPFRRRIRPGMPARMRCSAGIASRGCQPPAGALLIDNREQSDFMPLLHEL